MALEGEGKRCVEWNWERKAWEWGSGEWLGSGNSMVVAIRSHMSKRQELVEAYAPSVLKEGSMNSCGKDLVLIRLMGWRSVDWIGWRRDRGWVFMAGIGHGLAWVLVVLVGAEGRGSRRSWWWIGCWCGW